MTDTTKTTAKASRAKAAAAPKTQDAQQAAELDKTESARKFDNPDDLAHFIHHNPEFGTLPLDEQNALRAQLIDLKRAQAQA